MLTMTRIPVPAWAPAHAQQVRKTHGDLGEQARAVVAPLLSKIYAELERRVTEFANDPDQCFLDESEGFPVQERLDGQYYVGAETYEGHAADQFFRLWLEVRCLEKPWHPNQERDGYDYLGLEAIITLNRQGTTFEFDEGFNTSCI
ncbi:MAG: hypothetical protein NT013_13630 [Planctomycetia bacterium]|nr:hypothetical protein [Planctomycetia bacterium]